uniref:T-cell receptor alpha/delta variable 25.0.1 n=1 Tax=Cyprinus carpio TaxID=7962 RepID=A0A8C1VRM6_CYPCA
MRSNLLKKKTVKCLLGPPLSDFSTFEVYRTEKDITSLSCNYSSATRLYWYRQYPQSKSEVVELDPRFSGKLNKEKTRMYLEISSAKVTDSALYYCALEPTVTGKPTTLYKNLSYTEGKIYHIQLHHSQSAEIWEIK